MMGQYGTWFWMGGAGWLWGLVWAALVIVPFWRLLPRFGMPSWLAIFAVLPIVAVILLWLMAAREPVAGGDRG